MFKRYKIRSYEMGLLFRDGEFRGLVLKPVALVFRPTRQDPCAGCVTA